MIYLFQPNEKITADTKEVYRYSGFKGTPTDLYMEKTTKEIKEEIEKAAILKLCYTKIPLNNGILNFGKEYVHSHSLEKNLKGCHEVYVFAATAGIEIDRIINRYSTISPSKAVIAQGVGTALIERFCDCFCEAIAKEEEKNGLFLRPRFSPGYGDFDIKHQKDIINILDASKYIGVTLTDSLLMLPTKSVTAVMGVSKNDNKCIVSGCENCNKTNCEFRRN